MKQLFQGLGAALLVVGLMLAVVFFVKAGHMPQTKASDVLPILHLALGLLASGLVLGLYGAWPARK